MANMIPAIVCTMASLLAGGAGAKEKDSFEVSGFVGLNDTQPASKVVVKLLDGDTGKVVDLSETGFFAKFKFDKVKPGLYIIQVREFKHEILVKDKNKRVDFDLSTKTGLKRGFAERLADVASQSGGSGATVAPGPAPGPNDADLMQAMAGVLWGYSGSTEMQLTLCPNGTFAENSESSYSGSSRDSLGNQTGAWGAASQRGAGGNWSIQGSLQQGTITLVYSAGRRVAVPYRAVDNQCWSFDGRTLCRKGPAACR